MRNDLFLAAQESGLADKRVHPVSRKGTSLNPLSEKLIEDIWYLADCISSKCKVKRVMYKSSKRSAQYLENSLFSCNASSNAPSSVSSLIPCHSASAELFVHGCAIEQTCGKENEEEVGVGMGTPHLVRMDHSKSCDSVESVTDGPGHATGKVSHERYNVHAPKIIVTVW